MATFSIVIPTRARADTLGQAIQSALGQTHDDVEIVVQECGDDPATAETVAALSDPRIRFHKTGTQVPMSENWERALDRITGDYVFYLGDDDALLPDACAIAQRFFASGEADVLSWAPCGYFWPRHADPAKRNTLSVAYAHRLGYTIRASQMVLALAYRFREHYSRLPMIYNSFVPRRLIERVREKHGRYFIGEAPDVVSGVVNAFYSERFALCSRPLSISGLSHHSSGTRYHMSGNREAQQAALQSAFGERTIHATMEASPHLALFNGNQYLLAKDAMFPGTPPDLDIVAMLGAAARTINDVPGRYDETRAEIEAIARRNSIAPARIDIPQRASEQSEPLPAMPALDKRSMGENGTHLVADGAALGIATAHEAALFLVQHLPAADGDPPITREAAPLPAIHVDRTSEVTLDFGRGGNAALFVGPGWADLEDWGVWSLGPRSEVVVPFAATSERGLPLRVRIEGWTSLWPANPRITMTITSGDTPLARRTCEARDVAFDLRSVRVPARGAMALRLGFAFDRPMSAVEAGLSREDTREIALGLRRIVIAAER
jgi:glycosyltransferase involved in cell wall biosynthesis